MASPLIPLVRTAEDRVGSIRPAEGSSTVSLLVGDSRRQTFNIAAPKAVNLPSVGILAGERVIIKNVGTALLTVQSASGSLVATVQGTTFTGTALVDSPTASVHWDVSNPGEQLVAFTSGSSAVSGTTVLQSLLVPVGVWTLYGHADPATTGGGTDTVMLTQMEVSSVSGAIQDNESLAVSTFQGVAASGYRTGSWPFVVTLTSATTMYLNCGFSRLIGTVPTTTVAALRTLRAVRQN